MSALRGAIAAVIHEWFEEHLDAGCENHTDLVPLTPDCHHLAGRIVTDLDWPDVDR